MYTNVYAASLNLYAASLNLYAANLDALFAARKKAQLDNVY
jgi:hypothetical protein